MLNANRTALLREYLHGAELLTAALAALPPESLDHRPGPDRWTSREIVCHLADAEVQAYVRCRVILSEPGATLPNYDQDAWATALDYGETALGPAVDLVDRLRRINHTLLQDLPDEAWSRAATTRSAGLSRSTTGCAPTSRTCIRIWRRSSRTQRVGRPAADRLSPTARPPARWSSGFRRPRRGSSARRPLRRRGTAPP